MPPPAEANAGALAGRYVFQWLFPELGSVSLKNLN